MIKEEKKDEMKNKISMALKDPILQQGFEIICKNFAELKADNDARKFAMTMSEKVEKQLREQIEKMKNWCNCGNYQDCLFQRAEEGKGLKAEECHNCDKWEIKND